MDYVRRSIPGLTPWLARLGKLMLVALCVWLVLLQPSGLAVASIHTYHEEPEQTTLRSRQSLRDQNDLAWQATLFKRYRGGDAPALYLRLVGFPGQITIASGQDLEVTTGTLVAWRAVPTLDAKTKELPPNVGQYRMDQVLTDLQEAIPLTLVIPLANAASARLVVAPFVVQEWLELNKMVPEQNLTPASD